MYAVMQSYKFLSFSDDLVTSVGHEERRRQSRRLNLAKHTVCVLLLTSNSNRKVNIIQQSLCIYTQLNY